MAVRIRLKRLGRKHRPFYRVCAMDARRPRDGRVLEELGIYDPMRPEVDARAILNQERISYWLGVGAKPTEKAGVLIRKYGPGGSHLEEQAAALERMGQPRTIPDAGEPTYDPAVAAAEAEAAAKAAEEEAAAAKKAAEDEAAAKAAAEAAAASTETASTEATAEEAGAGEAASEEEAKNEGEEKPAGEG